MSYIIILLLAFLIVQQSFILRKTKRIDEKIWDIDNTIKNVAFNEFQQMQALDSLKQLLKLPYPLPPTRAWAGSPDFLLELAKATIQLKPKVVLECSCGTSTVVIARAIQMNGEGHVYSLEHDQVFADKTYQELLSQGLLEYATVIHAPLRSYDIDGSSVEWYSLKNLPDGCADMIVIDGPPADIDSQARYPAVPLLRNNIYANTTMFLDDAGRNGEKSIVNRWRTEMPELKVEYLQAEKGLAKITFPNLIGGSKSETSP